jgi:signal transduction histidine kinase
MLRLDRRYILPVALALALLTAFFALSEMRRMTIRRAGLEMTAHAERLRMLTDMRSLLTDAEVGERSFLLTGDRAYLRPLTHAVEGLPSAIDELRASYPADDASTQAALTALGEGIGDKLAELEATANEYSPEHAVDATGAAGAAASRMIDSERTMDSIRASIDGMRADERRRHDEAVRLWGREHGVNVVVIAAATVLNMLFVLLAGHLLTRDYRRRRAQTETLEQQVSERTQGISDLYTSLQQVIENEKGALARELHDELGSLLVTVKMDLSQLRRHWPADSPELEQRWQRIQSALSECIDLKRRVVEQLRPTLLDNMGLTAALRWQLQESCGPAGLEYHEHFPPEEPQITRDASIALFRIVQEALENVIKHARAHCVDLTVELRNDELAITVEDDGVGPATSPRVASGPHGVTSLQYRVNALGGEMMLGAGDGNRGTRVRIRFPMSRITSEQAAA